MNALNFRKTWIDSSRVWIKKNLLKTVLKHHKSNKTIWNVTTLHFFSCQVVIESTTYLYSCCCYCQVFCCRDVIKKLRMWWIQKVSQLLVFFFSVPSFLEVRKKSSTLRSSYSWDNRSNKDSTCGILCLLCLTYIDREEFFLPDKVVHQTFGFKYIWEISLIWVLLLKSFIWQKFWNFSTKSFAS